MVVSALFRIIGEQMVDQVSVRPDKQKQKMFVDFKQDIRTERSRQFFLDILNGRTVTYDGREQWTTHFIPYGVLAPLKGLKDAERVLPLPIVSTKPGHPYQYGQPYSPACPVRIDSIPIDMTQMTHRKVAPTRAELESEVESEVGSDVGSEVGSDDSDMEELKEKVKRLKEKVELKKETMKSMFQYIYGKYKNMGRAEE